MKINDVTQVSVNGMPFSVNYTDSVSYLAGDNLGSINHSAQEIAIKKSMAPHMRSLILWHEIAHAIAYQFRLFRGVDGGDDHDEEQIRLLASALNSVEIRFREKRFPSVLG